MDAKLTNKNLQAKKGVPYIALLGALGIFSIQAVNAESASRARTNSASDHAHLEQAVDIKYSSYTQYETRFLPGLNPCPSFTNNPTIDATDECHQHNTIQTQRHKEIFRSPPNTIVDTEVEPRANLFQIKFDRRVRVKK